MNILMLSKDPKIFELESEARSRMREYAEVLGRLEIIVPVAGNCKEYSSGGLFLHPVEGGFLISRLKIYKKALELCRLNKFDVITVQGPDDIGLIGYFIAKKFKIPLQIQAHTDIMSPFYRRASWKEFIGYKLAKFLIPRADCIRVVSKRIKDSLNSKFKIQNSKITVLPIYTDVSKFLEARVDPAIESRFGNHSFKMISVGRFVNKEKNFSRLIKIMAELVKSIPDVLLVLVGDGPDKINYESRIKNYGLQKNVLIEPWRNNLPAFYKSFDLFLLASNYEGWGRVVIETMASGLPVIMTDVGLAGEVVINNKNGLIVPVGNKKAFLEAIVALYKEPAERKRLAENGQETVKNLEPKTKEKYLALYKKSLETCCL